jgi:hypothetical protein
MFASLKQISLNTTSPTNCFSHVDPASIVLKMIEESESPPITQPLLASIKLTSLKENAVSLS